MCTSSKLKKIIQQQWVQLHMKLVLDNYIKIAIWLVRNDTFVEEDINLVRWIFLKGTVSKFLAFWWAPILTTVCEKRERKHTLRGNKTTLKGTWDQKLTPVFYDIILMILWKNLKFSRSYEVTKFWIRSFELSILRSILL